MKWFGATLEVKRFLNLSIRISRESNKIYPTLFAGEKSGAVNLEVTILETSQEFQK
jgi:hypothetical protein